MEVWSTVSHDGFWNAVDVNDLGQELCNINSTLTNSLMAPSVTCSPINCKEVGFPLTEDKVLVNSSHKIHFSQV